MTITPYPLCWPDGVPRTPAGKRQNSPFRTGYAKAIENVVRSLTGFQKDSGVRVEHPVLSSNVDLMGRLLNDDAGAAAWFYFDGQLVSFGVDRFRDTASNIQAIHHIIEARRVELRYGGLQIVKQTFRSFHALLPAPGSKRPWREVFGIPRDGESLENAERVYRILAKEAHPDSGGSHERMAELNGAIAEARKELT